MSSTSISGQCHCGAITFRAPDAIGVIACHCRDCQQMHGNFNPMVAVERNGLVVDGEVTWYASSASARRGFCSTCGSRLFKDNLGSSRMMVSVGTLDPPTGRRFIKHIWTDSKGDWYDIAETGALT